MQDKTGFSAIILSMKNLGLFLCLSIVFDLQAQDKSKKKKIETNISWEKGVKRFSYRYG